jgi:hypothetical protein
MLKIAVLVFSLIFVAGFIQQARADASRNPAGIPEQIQEANEIKEARQPLAGLDSLFAPWYRMKQKLSEQHGFDFSIAYTPLYQVASESLSGRSNQASGGIFEALATWALFDRGGEHPGRLGFRIENRHRLWSDVVPQSLSGEIGAGVPKLQSADIVEGVACCKAKICKQGVCRSRCDGDFQVDHGCSAGLSIQLFPFLVGGVVVAAMLDDAALGTVDAKEVAGRYGINRQRRGYTGSSSNKYRYTVKAPVHHDLHAALSLSVMFSNQTGCLPSPLKYRVPEINRLCE